MESKIGQKRKAFCSNCKGERNCEIKGHHRESGSDHYIQWWTNWYLLVCCGCDHVFAEAVSSDSESCYQVGEYPDGEPEYEQDERISSWPARFKRDRPNWFESLQKSIKHDRAHDFQSCLLQVYEALDHDLNVLAAIGIRTTFDVASEILGIDPDQQFKVKLNEMEKNNFITPSQRDDFEVLINAGNASAHRGWVPSFSDLDPLMETLEHFINDQFIRPELMRKAAEGVAKMKGKVPPKGSKKQNKQDKNLRIKNNHN